MEMIILRKDLHLTIRSISRTLPILLVVSLITALIRTEMAWGTTPYPMICQGTPIMETTVILLTAVDFNKILWADEDLMVVFWIRQQTMILGTWDQRLILDRMLKMQEAAFVFWRTEWTIWNKGKELVTLKTQTEIEMEWWGMRIRWRDNILRALTLIVEWQVIGEPIITPEEEWDLQWFLHP